MLAGCRKFHALLTIVAMIASGLYASIAMALDLGQLRVNSALNEPLDATIQLFELDGLSENQILVGMGSSDDFDLADLDRADIVDDIVFEIIDMDSETGVLIISSSEPVVEPFLNMVISVRWPSGRLIRNYTALIDSPQFASDEQKEIPGDLPQALAVDENDPEPFAEQVAPAAEEVGETVAEVVEPEASEGKTVTIESGDTLYEIAARSRPSTSVSVEQTMMAIQRINPDAFIDNNVNMIRAGEVIRIPSAREIGSIDQSQALNQIALQNQAASTQPLALSDNNAAVAEQGNDELTILSGEDGEDFLTGGSDLAETIAALENQLAISEENLDRARLENQELRSRFAELEEQVEILQNIIALQDERLAQLQADLAASAAEDPLPAESVAAQVADTPAQPPQQNDYLMELIDHAFENTVVLLSSLVALILLVVGFLVWRRRAAQTELEDYEFGGNVVADEPEAFDEGDEIEIDFSRDKDEQAPLATAFEEIDAQIEEETYAPAEDDFSDDFDPDNIDSSLFEQDDDESAEAPITDRDESSTKLDLAVAYEAMGDMEGAKEILKEVIAEGNENQIAEAKKLLEKWESS